MITRERGSSGWLVGALLTPVVLGLGLSGCTSAPTGTASPGATPEVTTASPSATPSSDRTASPSVTSQPANQVTIDITIADGQVKPNGAKMRVKVGQRVVLNVTSDEHDEIHAHTSGDGLSLEVPAGKKVTGSFTLTSPGSYEVESHHLGKIIVILNAR